MIGQLLVYLICDWSVTNLCYPAIPDNEDQLLHQEYSSTHQCYPHQLPGEEVYQVHDYQHQDQLQHESASQQSSDLLPELNTVKLN